MATARRATLDVCNLWLAAGFLGIVYETGPNLLPVSIRGRWCGREEGAGLRLAARALLSCHMPRLFTSAETAVWSPRAEHLPSRGAAGRPWSVWVREGVLVRQSSTLAARVASLPALLSKQQAAALTPCQGSPAGTCFLGSAFCYPPRPSPTPSGATALERKRQRAHPDLPSQSGDPAYVRHQLMRSPLPASPPRALALVLSMVLLPLPTWARVLVLSLVLALLPEMRFRSGSSLPMNSPGNIPRATPYPRPSRGWSGYLEWVLSFPQGLSLARVFRVKCLRWYRWLFFS